MPVVCARVSMWVYWCVCMHVHQLHAHTSKCTLAWQISNTLKQCVSRGNASALLFLSLPFSTPSTTAHQGLIVQHQPVCVLQQHEVIRRNTHSQRHKNLCSLQNMGIFVPVQTTLESDAVLLAFCAHMNFFLLGVYKYTHCAVAIAVIEL